MQARGFEPEAGMRLFNIVGMMAFATAIEMVRQREFEFQDETMQAVAGRQFSRLDASEFPLMAQALSVFTASPGEKTTELLRVAFASIARERGEDETLLFKEGDV